MTSENQLPGKIDLTTFFLSIAQAAYMGLDSNIELARQNIDLLELMQSKTKGNRSPDEDRLVDQLLFELRLRFVEKNRPTNKT